MHLLSYCICPHVRPELNVAGSKRLDLTAIYSQVAYIVDFRFQSQNTRIFTVFLQLLHNGLT